MTTRTATDAPDRPVLPWPCVAILGAELVVLGGLIAASPGRPPLTYEAGWLGAGSMLGMQLYSVRRRLRALRRLGSLRGWLDAHVFLGLHGFVLTAYHSVGVSPRANLAAINFALVAVVVLTGVVGRYLYGLLTRARAAELAAYAALGGRRPRSIPRGTLPPAPPAEPSGSPPPVSLRSIPRGTLPPVPPAEPSGSPPPVSLRSIALAARISALELAERWFSRWTLLHRPLAVVLLAVTALHVLAHFAYAT